MKKNFGKKFRSLSIFKLLILYVMAITVAAVDTSLLLLLLDFPSNKSRLMIQQNITIFLEVHYTILGKQKILKQQQ